MVKKSFIVHYKELKPLYVSNYWDHPLHGTCIHDGKLHEFNWEYDDDYVMISKLSFKEKLKWWYKQKKFEICIGYHWTYVDGKKSSYYKRRKPEFFWKFVFDLYYKKGKKK
jgi:hypothetical protein